MNNRPTTILRLLIALCAVAMFAGCAGDAELLSSEEGGVATAGGGPGGGGNYAAYLMAVDPQPMSAEATWTVPLRIRLLDSANECIDRVLESLGMFLGFRDGAQAPEPMPQQPRSPNLLFVLRGV